MAKGPRRRYRRRFRPPPGQKMDSFYLAAADAVPDVDYQHSVGSAQNRPSAAAPVRATVLSIERGYRSAGVIVLVTVLRGRAPVSLGHDTSSIDSSRAAPGMPPVAQGVCALTGSA
jgi:hypothetical protein